MFYSKYIKEALKKTWALDYKTGRTSGRPTEESSAVSLLVYNIFGGEILKTHNKNGWHFYNRIGSEYIDFARSTNSKFSENVVYDNLFPTPGETGNFLTEEDYSSFFLKFVRSYEEVVFLSGHKPNLPA